MRFLFLCPSCKCGLACVAAMDGGDAAAEVGQAAAEMAAAAAVAAAGAAAGAGAAVVGLPPWMGVQRWTLIRAAMDLPHRPPHRWGRCPWRTCRPKAMGLNQSAAKKIHVLDWFQTRWRNGH